MILGSGALWLNLLSMAVLSLANFSLVQIASVPLVRRLCTRCTPIQRKSLLLCWALSPWFWVTLLTASAFTGTATDDGSVSALLGLTHWHHADWFVLDSWHLGLLAGGALWISIAAYKVVRHTQSVRRQHRVLASLAPPSQDQQDVHRLPTQAPIAVTSGLWRHTIYLSHGLLERLTPSQREVVIQHERAHQSRRDNLSRWLMMSACAHLPKRVSKPVLDHYVLATEQLADRHAALHVGSGAQVADTLLQVARLSTASTMAAARFNDGEAVRERIIELLQPRTSSRTRTILILLALFIGALLTLGATDHFHHGLDMLFSHNH